MTKIQLAWVAGLLEGEGSFGFGNCKVPKSKTPRIQIQMTDKDVMQHLARILGVKLYGPYKQAQRKPAWSIMMQQWKPTLTLLTQLKPLMGKRRQQRITEVLKYCNGRTNTCPAKRHTQE